MAESKTLEIIIAARDEASGVINNFQGRLTSLRKAIGPAVTGLKQIGTVGLAMGGAVAALATKAAFSATRVEELGFALHAVAKANGIATSTVDGAVRGLRDMNIAHQQALEVTSLFVQSQLDLTDALKLANTAKDLAVVAGLDSSAATTTLTEAIASQEPMLLRQFGIVTTLPAIYEAYGAKVKKAADELTEAEKKQAFLNTILEAGTGVAGVYDAAMESVSKRFRSLTGRILPDFMVALGNVFGPALGVLVDAFSEKLLQITKWFEDPANQEKIKVWAENFRIGAEGIVTALGAIVTFLINNQEIILGVLTAIAVGVGVLVGAFVIAHIAAIAIFAAITAIVALFAKAWNENWGGIQDKTRAVVGWFKDTALPGIKSFLGFIQKLVEDFVQRWVDRWNMAKAAVEAVVGAIRNVISAAQDLANRVAKGLKIPGFQHGGFVPGGSGDAVPAILHGGERVIPRTGVDVNSGGGGGLTLSLNFTGPVSMDSKDRVQDLADEIISIIGRQNELAVKGLI